MGYFYFDESIHPRAGFIIGAFVYSATSLDPAVAATLATMGLRPGVDEFKSGARADANPVQAPLRNRLRTLIHHLGLIVAPTHERHLLGRDALCGLMKLLSANAFSSSTHEAHFDQGVFSSQAQCERWAEELGLPSTVRLFAEDDSKRVGGIQLADLAAHTMATMLLERLGHVNKTVKAGPNSGYDPDLDIEIGFELWASLRYKFFMKSRSAGHDPEEYDPLYDVSSCGLFVSPRCDPSLVEAVEGRFGTVYLGCIH